MKLSTTQPKTHKPSLNRILLQLIIIVVIKKQAYKCAAQIDLEFTIFRNKGNLFFHTKKGDCMRSQNVWMRRSVPVEPEKTKPEKVKPYSSPQITLQPPTPSLSLPEKEKPSHA